MIREERAFDDGSTITLTSDGPPPAWAKPIPDWVLEIASRIQPQLPEGVTIAIEQDSERPGVWELLGKRNGAPACLVCGVRVSGETSRILPPRAPGRNMSVGPDSEVCMPVVCPPCGKHMAGEA